MKNVCSSGHTVYGIDVSHYQPNVDWKYWLGQGVKFAFAKASEGAANVDAVFQKHWMNIKANGLKRGAYHFFHPSQDPAIQAKHFCSVVGHVEPGDLLFMDWETTDGVPTAKDRANGLLFLQTVEKLTGVQPHIYTGPYFANDLALSPDFAKYKLWIAHYGAKCPLVPSPWTNWTFWQFAEDHGMDKNVFNGTLDQLKALS